MVMVPLWLALALAAPGDAAQSVTVEIVTVGRAEAPADRFQLSALVTASGNSEAAAAALLAKRKQEVIDKARAAGAQVELREGSEVDLFSSDPMAAMSLMRGDKADVAAKSRATAVAVIIATTRASIDQAQAAVTAIDGVKSAGQPLTSLQNPDAARRAAKADGLAKARTEVDDYASRLGLPNVTLIGISEKTDLGSALLSAAAGDGKTPFSPFQRSTANVVATDVPMTVTFRLEAKR